LIVGGLGVGAQFGVLLPFWKNPDCAPPPDEWINPEALP